MQNLEIPVRKWESISVDFVALPVAVFDGHEVNEVLTVTDRATKMVHLIPCHNTLDAGTVAELFWWEVVRYHGMPSSIVSDRDKLFMSLFWTELMKFLDVHLRRSSPYHPQTNGQAERTNQTLKQVFRTLLLERPESRWTDLLVLAEIAINSAPIANTEYSPFYLNYGYHPTFWWDLPENAEPGPGAKKEVVRETVRRMRKEWVAVREAFKKEQQKALVYANRKRANYEFRVGQDVLISRRRHYKGQFMAGKGPLAPRAVGPFTIMRKLTPTTLVLDIPKEIRGRAHPVFHSSDLIPYKTRILDPVGMLPDDEAEDLDPPDEGGEGGGDEGGGTSGPVLVDPGDIKGTFGHRRSRSIGGSPLPEFFPEDPSVPPEQDVDEEDDEYSEDDVVGEERAKSASPMERGRAEQGSALGEDWGLAERAALEGEVPPRPAEDYEPVEDADRREEEEEEPPFDEGDAEDAEGEAVLQQGRGHPNAEPVAVLPPSISPQLRWWLDRMRGEGFAAEPERGEADRGRGVSAERDTPAAAEQTAGDERTGAEGSSVMPRSTTVDASGGPGEASPESRLGALQEDCFGEVLLTKLTEPQPLPSFEAVEVVKMKPEILLRMCRDLLVTPCIDLFASAKHHQFPRYFFC
jgi:hypothetical protein